MNKYYYIFFLGWLLTNSLFSQECAITITGYIKDASTLLPIEHASIWVDEIQTGTISDSLGKFELDELCPNHFHLEVSHIGCESRQIHLDIQKDTSLIIYVNHYAHKLHNVTITDQSTSSKVQLENRINSQEIINNSTKGLSDILETISGVSTLKNGSGISKPVVHGLYGNRITILNNGIAQAGQQWGNDHSPEIDPLISNKIKVIKGVGAIEYAGSSLGSLVLVEPQKISRDPHLHSKAGYFFSSNGYQHGTNIQVEKFNKSLGWKINGTLKKAGDLHTPDYWLTNTGRTEANLGLQLEKSNNDGKLNSTLHLSSFNSTIGILRGSHISNLSDLESALERKVPVFTAPDFSYQIDAPRQEVHHHLAKLRTKYFLSDHKWFDISIAGQLNKRKEFDIRRSGRSELPALDLEQYNIYTEAKYRNTPEDQFGLNTGVQLSITDNTNQPETGILPLIPDYRSYEFGGYSIMNKEVNNVTLEFGARYTHIYQSIAAISKTIPREILRYQNHFNNISASVGAAMSFTDISLQYNMGFVTRNPAINELYSSGLHQGVSGIEEGDPNLKSEYSFKSSLTTKGDFSERFFFESTIYLQRINDFIYLAPQDEIRLTIRGAFPVFQYRQTNARIYGWDMNMDFHLSDPLSINLGYSYIKGDDTTNSQPLVNIPANNLSSSLAFNIPQWKSLENIECAITNKYVFKQNHLEFNQDFVPTPDAYQLIDFKVSGDFPFSSQQVHCYFKVENLFNITYRDYLNRQRYFADDLGRNISMGLNLSF